LARQSDDSLKGPRRSIRGTIRNVHCTSPAILDFQVDAGGQMMDLHARNYFQIQFSALNFVPEGDLNPCSDLEGMHARVVYMESSSKEKSGGIVSVEISK
jgi:hypothetical protein